MLMGVLKDILKQFGSGSGPDDSGKSANPENQTTATQVRKVLNVGGNNKDIPIPEIYSGWQHDLLDIDPRGKPDVCCDARLLTQLPGAQYDAIYCSHNLEHYYRHDVVKVLAGFWHMLKDGGFVQIAVPDMAELMKRVAEGSLDIEDQLYLSAMGPIHVIDVIYGHSGEIEQSGNEFYAHKTGFTQKSLGARLSASGFSSVIVEKGDLEIWAVGFKHGPSQFAIDLFKLITTEQVEVT